MLYYMCACTCVTQNGIVMSCGVCAIATTKSIHSACTVLTGGGRVCERSWRREFCLCIICAAYM